jgi:hypothetical protein
MSFDYSKTRDERTNWRDKELSNRHRKWGFNCPAIDIDFLMIEYNNGLPVAIIDYKRYSGSVENVSQASFRAITALANNSNIPFFVVYYWEKIWAFKILPINDIGKKIIKNNSDKTDYTEKEFVTLLYNIRNINLTKQERDILNSLNNEYPPLL